jgi:hypothetical protein
MRAQQFVAPIEGGTQRLLAGRQITRPANKQRQAVIQASQQRCGRKEPNTGSCKFDCERQAIEFAANCPNGGAIFAL